MRTATLVVAGLAVRVAVLSSGALPIEDSPPSVEESRWLSDTHRTVIDSLMPMRAELTAVTFRYDAGWHYVGKEMYFRMSWTYKEGRMAVTSTVVEPVGRSIQEQLLLLHRADSSIAADDLIERLDVRRVSLTDTDCPIARRRMKALRSLPITVPEDVVIMDSAIYEFRIAAGSGRVDATLYDHGHPLSRWATRTYQELMRCAERKWQNSAWGARPSNTRVTRNVRQQEKGEAV